MITRFLKVMVCSCGKSYLSEVQDVILEMMFLDRMPPRAFVWLHQNPPECANKSLRIVPSTPHHVLHALALETCRALSYLQSYLRNDKSTSPPSSSKSGSPVEIELEIEGVTDIPTVTRRLLDGYSRSSHILCTLKWPHSAVRQPILMIKTDLKSGEWEKFDSAEYIRWIYHPKNSIFPLWDPNNYSYIQ